MFSLRLVGIFIFVCVSLLLENPSEIFGDLMIIIGLESCNLWKTWFILFFYCVYVTTLDDYM